MYITGSRADATPPRPSGVASSHGGRAVEAGVVGAAVVCQGCQSLAPAVRPFGGWSMLVSFPVPSGQGGRDAFAMSAGSSAPSSQPSCSQGGRSGVRVMAGPGAMAGSVASAVASAVALAVALAAGAAASCGADATGGSQPGTESPA